MRELDAVRISRFPHVHADQLLIQRRPDHALAVDHHDVELAFVKLAIGIRERRKGLFAVGRNQGRRFLGHRLRLVGRCGKDGGDRGAYQSEGGDGDLHSFAEHESNLMNVGYTGSHASCRQRRNSANRKSYDEP